jgi:very-short-patch-repair endonuclease
MSFNNNSYNKQTYITAKIVDFITNTTYFIIEKASLNINKIFYTVF